MSTVRASGTAQALACLEDPFRDFLVVLQARAQGRQHPSGRETVSPACRSFPVPAPGISAVFTENLTF